MADRETVFDALRNCVTEPKCKDCPWEDCEKIGCKRTKVPVTLLLDTLNLLREQPEQKHGHWKLVQDYYDDGHWQCSACGCEWYLEAGNPEENNMHYCPECGAKMDEDVKQDETD